MSDHCMQENHETVLSVQARAISMRTATGDDSRMTDITSQSAFKCSKMPRMIVSGRGFLENDSGHMRSPWTETK